MKYTDTVGQVVRLTVRNPFAVLLISVGFSASLLPFLTGIVVAGTVGAVVGLWTTSLLLGFIGVGGARIAVVVVEREVSLGTEHFWEGVRAGKQMGPAVGVGTFVIALFALLLSSNPFESVVGMSLALIGVYALLGWFVLSLFSLTLWASFERELGVRETFAEGGRLVLKEPMAAVWFTVQTIGWTLLSIPLIVAPVVILPGFIQLLGTAMIARAAEDSYS